MSSGARSPLAAEHFHAINAAICKQTIEESQFEYSVCMGAFTIHHGTRYGSPIVVVEHHNQQAGEFSGVWYDENK